MECLLAVCVYLTGGLGYQVENGSNEYGNGIGELGLTVQSKFAKWAYKECKHISGIQTYERDGGINACLSGFIKTIGPFTGKIGFGPQAIVGDRPTNEYGQWLFEASIMAEWEGLYAKLMMLDDLYLASAGWIKRFNLGARR